MVALVDANRPLVHHLAQRFVGQGLDQQVGGLVGGWVDGRHQPVLHLAQRFVGQALDQQVGGSVGGCVDSVLGQWVTGRVSVAMLP